MYTAKTFQTKVVDAALRNLGLYGEGMADLLLGTALHESGGFKWNKQRGGGPARGYFQMEIATHDDIWANYLKYHKLLAGAVKKMVPAKQEATAQLMLTSDLYAAAMAAVHYKRKGVAVPSKYTVEDLAKLWKKSYNTLAGAGTTDEFVADWNNYAKS